MSRKRKSPSFWVSATDTYNYMIKDPLVDWLKLYKQNNLYSENNIDRNNFFQRYIFAKGQSFETEVINSLKAKTTDIITISNVINEETCKKTIEQINLGTAIIHSAPFKNKTNHTQGIIDILIRSDKLHFLCEENPLTEEQRYYNNKYFYIAVDIKFSTIPLKANGIHILNSNSYSAYKSQLYIYTMALENLQNYQPNFAFILGRGYRYSSKGNVFTARNPFLKIGMIDFSKEDKQIVNETRNAIEWVRDVRIEGKFWNINYPYRKELFPNMCKDSGFWQKEKKEIAKELEDITQLWYCGPKEREKAFSNNIFSWKDCNSNILGIKNKRAKILDSIISINKSSSDVILPKKIKNNLFEWKNEENEIFVDFESFCDIFCSSEKTDNIFVIGIWHNDNNEWKYKSFVAQTANNESEKQILYDFQNFVKERNYPKIWYWYAEKNLWSKALIKYNMKIDNYNWCDLRKVFEDEPIVIKGCFNFGLKEVAKALYDNGLISTTMNSICNSGLSASILAWEQYQKGGNVDLADILEYNKFDVKVLYDILCFLRRI